MAKYVTVCWCCGKRGNVRTFNNPPTINPQTLVGKCVSSPDGKHKPRWEEV